MKKDELFNKNIPRALKARVIIEGGVLEETKKKWLEEDKEGLERAIKVYNAMKEKMKAPKVTYGQEFEEMIFKRAIELDAEGLTEGILDEKTLGGLKIFIDKTPLFCLYKVQIKDEAEVLAGKFICVGAVTL